MFSPKLRKLSYENIFFLSFMFSKYFKIIWNFEYYVFSIYRISINFHTNVEIKCFKISPLLFVRSLCRAASKAKRMIFIFPASHTNKSFLPYAAVDEHLARFPLALLIRTYTHAQTSSLLTS